jgi:hypothetical protein
MGKIAEKGAENRCDLLLSKKRYIIWIFMYSIP